VHVPNPLAQLVLQPGGLQRRAAGFHGIFITGHISSILGCQSSCKPLSGGIHGQLMEQRPSYRAGFALDITLGAKDLKHIAIAAVLSLMTQCCLAEDLVIMPGPSMYKCTQWMEAKYSTLRTPLAMWVFGFVSGSNFRSVENGSQAKVLDNEAALAFADKYCQDNPSHALGQLSIALVEKFGGPQSKHEWKK
jgi:hypothetical protein